MLLKRLFRANAALVSRYPWPVLTAVLVLTVILAVPAFQLRGNFNILNLLPMNAPAVVNLKDLLNEFGGRDRLLIAVECKDGADSRRFAERLREVLLAEDLLNEAPLFADQLLLSDDDKAWLQTFLFDNGIFLLDAGGVARCVDRLSDEGIRQAVADDRVLMRSGSPADRMRIRKDPLNLSEVFLGALPPRIRSMGSSTIRRSEDGLIAVLELKPVRVPQDGDFARTLLTFTRRCVDLALKECGTETPRVTFAGGYAMAASDTSRIIGVVLKTIAASILVVAVMLFLAFKEIGILFVIVPSLGVAILWTAGLARLFFGEITVVSAAFAAILIGLGVDFSIHIYNRFRIELTNGLTPADAMRVTHEETGVGVWLGALTTAAAFYILAISDFKGVREFGLLVGSGVLLSALIYFTGFSAVLNRLARRGFKRTFTREFGLGFIYDRIAHCPRTVITVFALVFSLALVYAFTGRSIGFENDPRNLRPRNDPVMAESERLAVRMGLSLVQFPVVVKAGSAAELMARTAQAAAGLKALAAEGVIADYLSPGDFLQTVEVQNHTLDSLETVDWERVRTTLQAELKANRFTPEAFADTFAFLVKLEARVRDRDILDEHELNEPRIRSLTEGFLRLDPVRGTYRSLSVFFPQPGHERDFDIGRINRAIGADDHTVFATGVNIIGRVVTERIAVWMMRIFPVVLTVIMLILFINFRSVRYGLLASAPLGIGVALLLASMKLLGVRFNVMNFGIIPMVIGIGVDNGIHIIRGYLDGPSIRDAVSITGRAVIMTSLTTIAGFGSLVIGEYQGIITMGIVAGLGVGYCLIATIFFLPAGLIVWGRKVSSQQSTVDCQEPGSEGEKQ